MFYLYQPVCDYNTINAKSGILQRHVATVILNRSKFDGTIIINYNNLSLFMDIVISSNGNYISQLIDNIMEK